MNGQESFPDFPNSPITDASRQSSVCSMSQDSESASLLFFQFPPNQTPPTSRPNSERHLLSASVSKDTKTLALRPSVTISFSKGNRLFKLKYSRIEISWNRAGDLKCIELGEPTGIQGLFVHAFPNSSSPVPHLEQPTTSGASPSNRISFLDEQTVQTAQTMFFAQPQYSFNNADDCLQFQEALFDQRIVFVAGVAEAKSKGRGEECISQNLRVLRARSGRQTMLFFANSQRRENKRYVSIPFDCIDQVEQNKKSGRPLSLRLRPNFELLSQLKTLHILFLDENDQRRFFDLLCAGIGFQAK